MEDIFRQKCDLFEDLSWIKREWRAFCDVNFLHNSHPEQHYFHIAAVRAFILFCKPTLWQEAEALDEQQWGQIPWLKMDADARERECQHDAVITHPYLNSVELLCLDIASYWLLWISTETGWWLEIRRADAFFTGFLPCTSTLLSTQQKKTEHAVSDEWILVEMQWTTECLWTCIQCMVAPSESLSLLNVSMRHSVWSKRDNHSSIMSPFYLNMFS